MKKMTLSLSVIILMISVCGHGWAQNFAAPTSDDTAGTANKINDLFSQFSVKIHYQIHNLTNECMSKVTKIPSDQKTMWCQELKQKKIAQIRQNMDRMGQENPYWNQQLVQLQDDLDRCQYIADEMLIDRCSTFEKNINMNIRRFSDQDS